MIYTNWYGFDTENDKQGKVTLTALVSEEGGIDVWKRAGCFRQWCDDNKDDSPVVICHNLEYDLVNEFAEYYPYLNLTYLHGRLIMAKYGSVAFLDSFNHYRMPLWKIGKAFGIEKLKFDINSPEYVATDAMICLKAMTFTRDYVQSLGGQLGSTAGSTAMSVWLAMEGEDYLTGPFDTPWLRRGYSGGRTEIFRRITKGELLFDAAGKPVMIEDELNPGEQVQDRKASIKGFDVNSMYPYCMMTDYPMLTNEDPKMVKKKGMAECTVSVPHDMYVGPLVSRDAGGRLVYPVGVFKGIWTYDELAYANSIGVQILKVHKAIGGNYTERPFDHFIETVYARRKASTNPAEREVLKVILNSLYGKLASKSTITRVVSKYNLLKNGSTRMDDVKWIDHNRGLLDFTTPQQRYVNVLWGAMITANARVLLTKYLRQVPPEKLVYCDTDSVYVNDFDLPTSDDLGGLKLEKSAKVMKVLQPKVYQLDSFFKAKGVPKPREVKREDYEASWGKVEGWLPGLSVPKPIMKGESTIVLDYARSFMEEGLAEFEAPLRFRQSIGSKRGKVNQWIMQSKSMRSEYTAKKLSGDRYYPPVLGQQQEMVLTAT